MVASFFRCFLSGSLDGAVTGRSVELQSRTCSADELPSLQRALSQAFTQSLENQLTCFRSRSQFLSLMEPRCEMIQIVARFVRQCQSLPLLVLLVRTGKRRGLVSTRFVATTLCSDRHIAKAQANGYETAFSRNSRSIPKYFECLFRLFMQECSQLAQGKMHAGGIRCELYHNLGLLAWEIPSFERRDGPVYVVIVFPSRPA